MIRAPMITLMVLATLGVPRTMFACTSKLRAFVAAMRSDLRHLGAAQQAYRQAHGRYAGAIDSLGLETSIGVRLVIEHADSNTWAGAATHERAADHSCRITGHVDPAGQLVVADPTCVIPPGESGGQRVFYSSLGALLLLTLVAGFTSPREPSMRMARRLLLVLLFLSPLASVRQTNCRSDPHPAVMLALVALGAFILIRGLRGRRLA